MNVVENCGAGGGAGKGRTRRRCTAGEIIENHPWLRYPCHHDSRGRALDTNRGRQKYDTANVQQRANVSGARQVLGCTRGSSFCPAAYLLDALLAGCDVRCGGHTLPLRRRCGLIVRHDIRIINTVLVRRRGPVYETGAKQWDGAASACNTRHKTHRTRTSITRGRRGHTHTNARHYCPRHTTLR